MHGIPLATLDDSPILSLGMGNSGKSNANSGTQAQFPPETRWTLIIAAGGSSGSSEAHAALNQLCQLYWFPLYAFIRREGNDCHKAKDLTQDFLSHVLETEFFKKIGGERGRFRSYLCESCRNFLKDDWRKGAAKKRGGGAAIISIDEQEAETRYDQLPKSEPSSDRIYDQAWAKTVVRRVLDKLQQEYCDKSQAPSYQAFLPYLVAEPDEVAYQDLIQRLNRDKATLQVIWHRLRRRFGELLRKEITDIVEDPKDVAEELRHLLAAWATASQASHDEPIQAWQSSSDAKAG
jgi:RNA polymerase sigma-70 factor (ECF subfamily)